MRVERQAGADTTHNTSRWQTYYERLQRHEGRNICQRVDVGNVLSQGMVYMIYNEYDELVAQRLEETLPRIETLDLRQRHSLSTVYHEGPRSS